MGLLADRIGRVPAGWEPDSGERVAAIVAADDLAKLVDDRLHPADAWLLWLEAEWARRAKAYRLAERALDAADVVAEEGNVSTPTWAIETYGLRAKVLQDNGEPGRAHEALKWAKDRWLAVVRALHNPVDDEDAQFAQAAMQGAAAMVAALVEEMPFEAAVALWLADRVGPEAREMIARAVKLEADVASYADARRMANDALAATRSCSLPGWDPIGFEVTLRTALSGAAYREQRFEAAIGQADDGLALAARMPAGADRTRAQAELRHNRAGALFGLGRCAEATPEIERARAALEAIGARMEALHVRSIELYAREGAGEAVGLDAVRSLLADLEREPNPDELLMADLEWTRRWMLSLLADEAADDLEEVVGIIEALRDDRPLLRTQTEHRDPALALVCRPLTLLAARLARLHNTTLVVLEPGLGGGRERPPVLLVVSSAGDEQPLRWHLAPARNAADALLALGRLANVERERLLTGELSLRASPSVALGEAAAAAWNALPSEARGAIRAARTVLYMPSGADRIDTLPFELLLHEGGHLGATHVVARCPSFQQLENMLSPNARCRPANTRALVALTLQDEQLGRLPRAMAEGELAEQAAALLGLEAERRELNDPADALEAFRHRALVHYVGHGFAGAIGEVLALSRDRTVSASELPDFDGTLAPFVFFNSCLLGRVRHLSGAGQRGWAFRLLDQGAPAVVGTLAAIPDDECIPVAEAFYWAACKAPLGEAMRLARARLHEQGLHPAVWSAYVLHGDPNAYIAAGVRASSADLVRRWPAHATRFLATRAPQHRDAVLDATRDRCPAITAWINNAAAEHDLAAAADELLDGDPEGAAVCRLLLAVARHERDAAELDIAYLLAAALGDGYAMLHVIAAHIEAWEARYPGRRTELLGTARWWLASLEGDRDSPHLAAAIRAS